MSIKLKDTIYDLISNSDKLDGKDSSAFALSEHTHSYAASSHTHTKSQITDFPTSMPASDVYAWAKAATKPSYNFGEIGAGIATIGDGTNRIMWRTNASWSSGVYYSTPNNESVVFANKNSSTSWIFATADPTTQGSWESLTPSLQIKNQRVTINKAIATGTEAEYNLDVNGSFNAISGYINKNAIIHAGNIGSQSVSYATSAGSASTATSATSATKASYLSTSNTSQSAASCYSDAEGLHFYRYSGDTTANDGGDGFIMQWSWGSGSVGGQIYLDDNPSRTMMIRGRNNDANKTFTAWSKFLHSDNYTSYTVTKTGTGASGTWGINISGNAATATSATTAGSATTATSAGKLSTARTISLTGSVTGSGNFDGSGNLSIAITTNHTHNYAATDHTHSYLPLSGGTVTNNVRIRKDASNSSTITPTSCILNLGTGTAGHTGYHTGIGFNALSYGSYINHIHAWIGMGPYTTTASAECYPLVFATNENTTTDTAPTVRMTISPSGVVNVVKSLTVGGTAVSLSGHTHDYAPSSHGHSYFSMNSGISLSSIVATADSTYLWNKSSNAFVFTNSNNAISLVVGGTSNDRNAMIQVGHSASSYGQHTGNLYLNKLGGKVYYGTSEVSVVGHTHSQYLPLAGGTMTGCITTPGNDTVVIKPAKNNYDQIGASDCYFWKAHVTNTYTTNLYIGGEQITFTT